MIYRMALPLLALLTMAGCSGRDATSPVSREMPSSLATLPSQVAGVGGDRPSAQRSGVLLITKECSQYTRLTGGFCTITSSNIPEIVVGTKVVYTKASGPTSLNTDVTLVPPQGENIAYGHVELNLATGHGHAVFSGGKGKLRYFYATVAISSLGRPNWQWDGTYYLQ
jgi:hypothetical protein